MIIWCSWGDGSVLNQLPEHVTRCWGLVLNPMRGRTEEKRFLAVSDSRDELRTAWQAERVEPYADENWRKSYRQGGQLEWFNPPFSDSDRDNYGFGIVELRRDGWRMV